MMHLKRGARIEQLIRVFISFAFIAVVAVVYSTPPLCFAGGDFSQSVISASIQHAASPPNYRGETFSAAEVAQIMAETPAILVQGAGRPSDLQISPDGEWVVYPVTRKSLVANRVMTEYTLQRVPKVDNTPGATVRLPNYASAVRWCPDSRCLSMIIESTEAKSVRKFVLYNIANGGITEIPVRDTARKAGGAVGRPLVTMVGDYYQWSPKGNFIAFSSPLVNRSGLDQFRGVSPLDLATEEHNGLFVLDVATGIVKQLTPDSLQGSVGYLYWGWDWAPDESAIVAAVIRKGHIILTGSDLIVVDRTSGDIRELVARTGMNFSPKWSPDGRWIAFSSTNGELSYRGGWPAIVPAKGGPITSFRATATPTTNLLAWWSPDSRAFYYKPGLAMASPLVRIDITTRTVEPLTIPGSQLSYDDNYSASADGRWVTYTRDSITSPQDLFVVALGSDGRPTGKPRQLTRIAPSFPLTAFVHAEAVSWPSKDRMFTIHGLLLTPTAAQRRVSAPFPTLLFLYGGPGMVKRGWAADGINGAPLALAVRGYAVLIPNTRGRSGYGEAFALTMRNGQGRYRLPYEDAMAGIDWLTRRGVADSSRLGILGHSYGGALTAYTITRTAKFKAAVMHEGIGLNLLDGDKVGYEVDTYHEVLLRDLWGIRNPFDAVERQQLIAESPLLNANKVKTPTLMHYAFKVNEAREGRLFFNALQRFHIPSALFIFDEGHVFQRPAAIADDLTRIGEWLDHWVRGFPYPDAKRATEYEAWTNKTKPARYSFP